MVSGDSDHSKSGASGLSRAGLCRVGRVGRIDRIDRIGLIDFVGHLARRQPEKTRRMPLAEDIPGKPLRSSTLILEVPLKCLAVAAAVALATAGCSSTSNNAAAPADPAPAAVGGGKPGMDARGNVVDSSKVEAGSGRTVKGLKDFEGEITGNPAADSKFARLQIGMSTWQVEKIAGRPTEYRGAYATGKGWIPFYFGRDRHRFEMAYKGQGRLIFAGGGVGDFTNGNLVWIIHNPNEAGYYR